MSVKADPKAIAARRMRDTSKDAVHSQANSLEVRQANLQRKKRAVDEGKAKVWRKEHGLMD